MGTNMNDPEEVKRYLDNLNLEYQFSCYKENNGEGCCLLGEFMTNVREDFERAATAFKKGCDKHDHPKACFKYGGALFRGRGVKQNFFAALEYQKKACELKWKDACLVAAYQYTEQSTPNSEQAAFDYFIKACDLGQEEGCSNVSSLYYEGGKPVRKNLKTSVEYGIRACDLGHAQSCANISYLYKIGRGVEKDEKMSQYYKDKALDIQDQWKRNRGFEMEQGIKDS